MRRTLAVARILLIIHFLFYISYQAVQKILTVTTAFCSSGCILHFLKCTGTIFYSIFNHSICYISAMTCFFTSIHIFRPSVALTNYKSYYDFSSAQLQVSFQIGLPCSSVQKKTFCFKCVLHYCFTPFFCRDKYYQSFFCFFPTHWLIWFKFYDFII